MYKNILIALFISVFFIACSSTKNPTLPSTCLEKPSSGMCKALFYKYYYDEKDGSCKKFVWGGCGGNVPFQTLKECKSSCEK